MASRSSPTPPVPTVSGRLEACRFNKHSSARFYSVRAVSAPPWKRLKPRSPTPDDAPATTARRQRLTPIWKNDVHADPPRCGSAPFQTTSESGCLRAPVALPVRITENTALSTCGVLQGEPTEGTLGKRPLPTCLSQAAVLAQPRRYTVAKTTTLKEILQLPPQPTTVIVALASPKQGGGTSPQPYSGNNEGVAATAPVGSRQPQNAGRQSPQRPFNFSQFHSGEHSGAATPTLGPYPQPQQSGAQSLRSIPRGSPQPNVAAATTPAGSAQLSMKYSAWFPRGLLRGSPPQNFGAVETTTVGSNMTQNEGVPASRSFFRASPGEYLAPATSPDGVQHPRREGAEPLRRHHRRRGSKHAFTEGGEESRTNYAKSSVLGLFRVVEVKEVKRKTVWESFVEAVPLFLLLIVLCLLCIWAIYALRSYKPAAYSYRRRQDQGRRDSAADSLTVSPEEGSATTPSQRSQEALARDNHGYLQRAGFFPGMLTIQEEASDSAAVDSSGDIYNASMTADLNVPVTSVLE